MEIWQKGKGKENPQVDGINCKHMTQSVLPWLEVSTDIPECSWREERDVQHTSGLSICPTEMQRSDELQDSENENF